jgi:hypothetical protein
VYLGRCSCKENNVKNERNKTVDKNMNQVYEKYEAKTVPLQAMDELEREEV